MNKIKADIGGDSDINIVLMTADWLMVIPKKFICCS